MTRKIRMHDTKSRKMHDFLHWLRKTINNQIPLTTEAFISIHQTVISEGERRMNVEFADELNQIIKEEYEL